MKRMKKILALLTAATMALGMSVTSMAANGDAYRDENDTATVKITGIKPVTEATADSSAVYPTVSLYQIAEGTYKANNQGFDKYVWVSDSYHTEVTDEETGVKQVQVDFEAVTEAYKANSLSSYLNKGVVSTGDALNVKDGVFSAEVKAGAYVAFITGATDTIYNPILLTATYGTEAETTQLVGGTIPVTATYLYGSTGVAKSSTPGLDKDVSVDDNAGAKDTVGEGADQKEIQTVSVGDTLTYTITPSMPSYPSDATNKTVYVRDTMSDGLTFKYDTLTVKITGKTITSAVADGVKSFSYTDQSGTIVVVAKAIETANGFKLVFDYDALLQKDADGNATGAVDVPTVEYKAVVNEQAVVGTATGNINTADLYYANNPYDGSSYKTPDPDNPDENDDKYTPVRADQDETNTVYAYQLAFFKTDAAKEEGDEGYALAGATFGIYSALVDGKVDESKLIDTVVTDENGYAVSKAVSKGTYYVKELAAPTGYALEDTVHEMEACWTSTTTKVTTTFEYTAVKPSEDAVQAGWLMATGEADAEGNIPTTFKTFAQYAELKADEQAKCQKAYVEKKSVTSTTVAENSGNGSGTALKHITNTTMTSLPSTGGIGTTIFTIGGCAIMILAAALYFATRRKTVR